MAVTHKLYGPFIKSALEGDIPDMGDAGTVIKCALLDVGGEGYTFSADHDTWSDVSAYEIADGDYTPGGIVIANKSVTYSTRVTTFDTSDAKCTQTAEGAITAGGAVIYYFVDDGEGDPDGSASKLISFINFGGDETSDAGEFSISWHENGILTVTVAE